MQNKIVGWFVEFKYIPWRTKLTQDISSEVKFTFILFFTVRAKAGKSWIVLYAIFGADRMHLENYGTVNIFVYVKFCAGPSSSLVLDRYFKWISICISRIIPKIITHFAYDTFWKYFLLLIYTLWYSYVRRVSTLFDYYRLIYNYPHKRLKVSWSKYWCAICAGEQNTI